MIKIKVSVLAICCAVYGNAYAGLNCCSRAQIPAGVNATYDASCTTTVTGEFGDTLGCCKNAIVTNTSSDGIVTTKSCSNSSLYNPSTKVVSNTCLCGVATPQCDVGYYQSSTRPFACEPCPSSGGIYGTTAAVGATSITECYLPAGREFSDATGSGIYTDDCYYVAGS